LGYRATVTLMRIGVDSGTPLESNIFRKTSLFLDT
jgi:hypothetical protein